MVKMVKRREGSGEVVEGGCGMRHEIILVEDMDGKRRG